MLLILLHANIRFLFKREKSSGIFLNEFQNTQAMDLPGRKPTKLNMKESEEIPPAFFWGGRMPLPPNTKKKLRSKAAAPSLP